MFAMFGKVGYLWSQPARSTDEIILKGYIDLGLLGKVNIKCLVNKRKLKPNEPDYDIVLGTPPKDEESRYVKNEDKDKTTDG